MTYPAFPLTDINGEPMSAERLAEIEAKIADLAAKAEPLRALHEDDPQSAKLGPIVDQINALRREENQLKTGYIELKAPPGSAQPAYVAHEQEMLEQGIDPRVPPGTSINQARATLHLPKRS